MIRPAKTFQTRDEAEEFRAAKANEMYETPSTRNVARRITVAEFTEEFERLRIGPCGQRMKIRFLVGAVAALMRFAKHIGNDCPLTSITPADCIRYFETIRVSPKKDGPTTIAWTSKSYQSRTIPVPPQTMAILQSLLADADDGQSYVFVPPRRLEFIKDAQTAGHWREDRFILNNFHREFPKIVRKAAKSEALLMDGEGKPAVTLHDLRRTAITNWTKRVNIQTAQKLAGHRNVETTLTYYAAATQDQLDKAREAGIEAIRDALNWTTDPFLTHLADPSEPTDSPDSSKSCGDKALKNWVGPELNRRHTDFQSVALPTELPTRVVASPPM